MRVDGKGQIITFLLTPGQTHEISVAEKLMEQGAVRRCQGRPRLRPGRVVGDKGYTSKKFRSYLRRRGIRVTIARLSNQRRRGPFDKENYRQRNKVERMIGRIKEFRRIATRYEKRAANYSAMLPLRPFFCGHRGLHILPSLYWMRVKGGRHKQK